MSRDLSKLLEKWSKWLQTIEAQVGIMLHDRMIAKGLVGIAEANPAAREPPYFFDWCFRNYAISISVRMRRLVDVDNRSVSLLLLLTDVEDNADAITRAWFASRYTSDLQGRGVADTDFDEWSRPHDNSVSPAVARQHLNELLSACEPVKQFVNKRVAHHDRAPDRAILSLQWGEVDHALDVIEAKTIACKLLIDGHGPHTLQPGDTSDWDQIFETTWKVRRPVKRDSAPEYW